MAKYEVEQCSIPLRVVCVAFMVSESCYRYASKHNADDEAIANWLMCLTDKHRTGDSGCATCTGTA
ncbi:hypothetical protein [Hydrogenophaga sp. PAMC20947]|uniref:hypothetical protein n=1 Tax=Hydrogenophaga sp. PAMC20947 TaxID=2565558 RepID=UPI00109E27C1|nr:hypothetical protein [Hydrogenophaga sp. PAMC20947]QCB46339.1 hypothetical protein E5678_10075 [Hydrogenophaga sp. PAMC20947]